jgi:hypothetical protein
MAVSVQFPQGMTVGQAMQHLVGLGVCDIVLDPVYDPFVRPAILCDLNVYAEAGATRYSQAFAWDAPGKSIVDIDREEDGGRRANVVAASASAGGDAGTAAAGDDTAADDFGVYEAHQFYPEWASDNGTMSDLAAEAVAIRAYGVQTVTFTPAPDRGPRPWQDYQPGDRVPVWATPEKFRRALT